MILFRRLAIVFLFALSFTSCGGGSSSSGSGIGGTGITLVRGNVTSVDGQLFVLLSPEGTHQSIDYLTEWIIPLSYAQSGSTGSLTVSGGGQTTSVNSAGEFELPGVTPSANFVLTFKTDDNDTIPLGIGEVLNGAVVTVKNIRIDTKSGSAKPADIDVEEPAKIEDDISEDLNSETETEEEDEEEEEDSQDDNSEDGPEDVEDSDDSVDDVSNDDEK